MFRGTKKYGPEEFSNIIQQNGGMDNAFTGSDFTDYFEVINRDHLDVPIGLEADRMANFDPKGFDSESSPWWKRNGGCAPTTIRRTRSSEVRPGAGLRRASVPLAGDRLDARHPAA